MIPVPMTSQGSDMDTVVLPVAECASVKGIWCFPEYSNPDGISYGHPDRAFVLGSTLMITFAGSGVGLLGLAQQCRLAAR